MFYLTAHPPHVILSSMNLEGYQIESILVLYKSASRDSPSESLSELRSDKAAEDRPSVRHAKIPRAAKAARDTLATEWLRTYLARGARPSDELLKAAQIAGFKPHHLRDSAHTLGIVKTPIFARGGGRGCSWWSWEFHRDQASTPATHRVP